MKRLASMRLIAVATIFAAVGCVGNNRPELPSAAEAAAAFAKEMQSVDTMVGQQRYSDAINALEFGSRTNNVAERQQRLKQVRELAANYDKVMNAAIQEAIAKQDFPAAYRLVYAGIRNYPEGVALQAWQTALAPRQTQRIAELQTQVLIERANWVLSTRPILEDLVATNPGDPAAAQDLDRARAEAQTLALKLSSIGVDALVSRDVDTADRCLTTADRLHPIAENILALERLDHLRYEWSQEQRKQREREDQERARADAERRKQQFRVEEERQQQESRRLVDEIYTALGSWDLLRGQALLAQLHNTDANNAHLADLDKAMESAVATRVDELVEKGNNHYSNGEIAEAKDSWEEALKLRPSNAPIRARIARAEQVLANLHEQQKQAAPDK